MGFAVASRLVQQEKGEANGVIPGESLTRDDWGLSAIQNGPTRVAESYKTLRLRPEKA
jgi:hypothetical protein